MQSANLKEIKAALWEQAGRNLIQCAMMDLLMAVLESEVAPRGRKRVL